MQFVACARTGSGQPPSRPACTTCTGAVRSTVARKRSCGRSTGTAWLSVGPGQPTGRPRARVGRPRGVSGRIYFSFQDSDFVSELESNPIGFPKILGISGYKYKGGALMNCIASIPLVSSCNWLLNQLDLSLPCPEDVGKLSNLIKYCVGFLSWFLCSYLWVLLGCIYWVPHWLLPFASATAPLYLLEPITVFLLLLLRLRLCLLKPYIFVCLHNE